MQVLKCAICGKEFETQGGNVKYCSIDCKKAGQRMRRKEWENRTNYKEKQRIIAQNYREEQAKKAEKEAKEESRKRKSAETKAKRKKERQQKAELEKKAAKGEKMALLRLAVLQGNALEYWRIRKEMTLEEDEAAGKVFNNTVSGISFYEDAFEHKVVALSRKEG